MNMLRWATLSAVCALHMKVQRDWVLQTIKLFLPKIHGCTKRFAFKLCVSFLSNVYVLFRLLLKFDFNKTCENNLIAVDFHRKKINLLYITDHNWLTSLSAVFCEIHIWISNMWLLLLLKCRFNIMIDVYRLFWFFKWHLTNTFTGFFDYGPLKIWQIDYHNSRPVVEIDDHGVQDHFHRGPFVLVSK